MSGEVNWDFELFRILPSVFHSKDYLSMCRILSEWIAELEDPEECNICAELPAEFHLKPDLEWIYDKDLLGDSLSERLQIVYNRRPANLEQYYVTHVKGIGNPDFSREAPYTNQHLPDAGYRLLALFRLWNIVEYWFPYRDVIGEDWSRVLAEFVPQILAVDTVDEYYLSMIALNARIKDTHANVWAHLSVQPPRGSLELPIVIRFIEGKPVVTGFSNAVLGPATGLEIGDVIEEIDGQLVESLVQAYSPYYPASNKATRLRDIARKLTRGDNELAQIIGARPSGKFTLSAKRATRAELDLKAFGFHDLPGETFQLLSDEVAYLKLSSVAVEDIGDYIARAGKVDVLVVDIRNYPKEFVVFALGGHLVTQPTDFARFTVGDALNPGAFVWTSPVTLRPLEPHFPGTVVILVDEVSQSQAEYTAMALRSAPNSVVVGSTTAGADGNVSHIPLPGGLSSMISGIGVFYPDGTPTQRIGIIPDLEVRPTIKGVREGRDEVLEAGISYALGREFKMEKK
jgi:hypothetical protein